MRALSPLLLVIAASSLGAACAGIWLVGRRGDQIKFSHVRHETAKIECVACHEPVYDAKTLGVAGALPTESKCLECHKPEKEKANCAFCHTDGDHPRTYEKREHHLRLSHADHLARVDERCADCHTTLPEPGPDRDTVPPMSTCVGCHEHKGAFLKRHAMDARAAGASCAQCHEQMFCSDCHAATTSTSIELKLPERVDRQFIHRSDFLSRHTIEAKADSASCARCHGKAFCESCHAAQNLTPLAASPRNPHPRGWSFPGSPFSHGMAARRDIASCASCHDQGPRSLCIDCHRVGGIGGSPHPPGWAVRHGPAELGQNSMCLSCHP